jgi:hypothetical protein
VDKKVLFGPFRLEEMSFIEMASMLLKEISMEMNGIQLAVMLKSVESPQTQ